MGDLILVHSGVKGQKWGKRNYRNYDGTLTEEGKKRYDYYDNKTDRAYDSARSKQTTGTKKDWIILDKKLSKYTSSELKALNERAELERKYNTFYNKNKFKKISNFISSASSVINTISTLCKTIDTINKIVNPKDNGGKGGGKP